LLWYRFQRLQQHQRLTSLDAVRGLAVLWVFLFHLSHRIARTYQFFFVEEVFRAGLYTVQIFFCVSGFLMFLSLKSKMAQGGIASGWKSFLFSRGFRILPLWWLTVLIYGITLRLDVGVFLSNLTFVFGALSFDARQIPIVVSWSLFVEVVFYLLAPLLFLSVSTLPRAVIFFLGAILIGLGWVSFASELGVPQGENYIERSPINNFQFFALGILGFFLFERGWFRSIKSLGRTLAYCALVLFGFRFILFRDPVSIHLFCAALIGVSLIASQRKDQDGGQFRLTNRPLEFLRFLGRICYPFYLSHLYVFDAVEPLRKQFFRGVNLFGKPAEFQAVVWGPVIFLTCLLIAWILHRLVEEPMMSLGRKLRSETIRLDYES
jgi:peptidoglycan/LPS O-acetylase OafA/YrhL